MSVTRVFFDTEFTSLWALPAPALISTGFISQDGARTFYAELSDTWQVRDCSHFVCEAVLPQLEGGIHLMTMAGLASRLRTWLVEFGSEVLLATDSLSFDWPWIGEIFGEDGYPENLVRPCEGISFERKIQRRRFLHAQENAYREGLRRHHALDDAKANRVAWLAMRQCT